MFLKYFIKIGLKALIQLLEISLSDKSKAKPIIDILLYLLKRIYDILTDDDKDNTEQIENFLLNEFQEHLSALNDNMNRLKEI